MPLLSSIKPIGHYAMLGCPARGPARPGQGSSINHMSQRKEAGKKKSESECVLGTCLAAPSTASRLRRLQPSSSSSCVLSIPLHNLHSSRQILIANANHKLNLESASRCAALRRCYTLSLPPCSSRCTSLSPVSLFSFSLLSVSLSVCARKYIMLNKLLCTVWGLHLAADESARIPWQKWVY